MSTINIVDTMVFGIDDVFEGFTVFEIISAIGAEVIEAIGGTAATATATVGETFSNILGEGGVQTLIDFVKIGAGKASEVGVNVESIDALGGQTLKNAFEEGSLLLWEDEPEIQQIVPKGFFIEKVKELAANLIKQGVDMKDLSGRQLLFELVNRAIKKGKFGIAVGTAGAAALAPLGLVGLVKKFKKATIDKIDLSKTQKVEDDDEMIAEIKRFPN